jgi:hypothetical protein
MSELSCTRLSSRKSSSFDHFRTQAHYHFTRIPRAYCGVTVCWITLLPRLCIPTDPLTRVERFSARLRVAC